MAVVMLLLLVDLAVVAVVVATAHQANYVTDTLIVLLI